ncbi:MAG TPA: Ig-like domain-containing protein [Candidatus Binatia bacterium]|nr:Ig-like domain-containing protein [Candidatus Binatia bacterium]
MSRKARLLAALAAGAICSLTSLNLSAQTSILTGRNDNFRDGLFSSETLLTTSNVNMNAFGNLFSYPVDGYVSAQPLYVPGVQIAGVNHNVVYVATENDSVFAFDADSAVANPNPLWQVSLLPAGMSGPFPISLQGCGGNNGTGLATIGILSTPVIDPTTNTMYVVVKAYAQPNPFTAGFWLYALDITSGALKFGSPTQIQASINSINGIINFSPVTQMQRPALLLSNGTLFIAFGSNGCDLHDHGWVMAYSASTLQQVENGVFNASPDVVQGSAIWMSGSGPAADANGYIYVVTANGDFDINTGGSDYGDSVVKLQLGSNGLTVADYFTPYDQQTMDTGDLDLGSGGVMLLPSPQNGSYPDLMIAAGKTGTIYLINRDDLGEYDLDGNGNNDQIPQYLQASLLAEYGTATAWNNYIYFSAHNDFLKAYTLNNGALSASPVAQSSTHYEVVGVPVASANGNLGGTNGIVWVVRDTVNNGPQALYAYNATPSGSTLNLLYNTNQLSTRDALGATAHFATPIVDNGHVYVGTQTNLMVYGLLPTLTPNSGNNQSGTVGTALPNSLTVQATDSYQHQPISGITVNFTASKGTVNPASAVTDSNGMASTQYTLPTASGAFSVTASTPNSTFASGTFSETATPGTPATLSDVSGSFQSATVGTALPAALLVRLKDAYGNVVPGQPVAFTDGGAGGTFSPPSPVTTDSTGTATVNYTVPTKAETVTIIPSFSSLSGKFSEKSVAGAAAAVTPVSGNNQTGEAGNPLPNPLVAGVKDQYGNPVAGLTVTFSDNGSGGTFSNPTPVTNAQGQASVTYTLSKFGSGSVTITATVGNLVADFMENSNLHGHKPR